LDPTVLYKCPSVVLGALRPKLVIISTPNSEFNVHFGPREEGILRHDDHRFEWTRKEFQTWCERIAKRYGYSVNYDGVGDPKPEFPNVGFCTQIAIFQRQLGLAELEKQNISGEGNILPFPLEPEVQCSLWTKNPLRIEEPSMGEYTLFHKMDYPCFVGNIHDEIHHSLVYCFKMMSRNEHNEYDTSIPITVDDVGFC
jgi:hypothetical protein